MAHQTQADSRTEGGNSLSPGFRSPDFGADHHHKPTKAVVGVAILVVLSFVLYEFGGKAAVQHSSSAQINQTVASSNH